MSSPTDQPTLPSAGGSYRLDGETLTPICKPTAVDKGRHKKARFVGGDTKPAKSEPAKPPKS